MLTLISILLVVHYLCDFTHLSTNWMLAGKAKAEKFWPLVCHALVHALSMAFVISIMTNNNLLVFKCFMVQLCAHFTIDLFKGISAYTWTSTTNKETRPYWYIMGLDQLAHQLTIVIMVAIVYNS